MALENTGVIAIDIDIFRCVFGHHELVPEELINRDRRIFKNVRYLVASEQWLPSGLC